MKIEEWIANSASDLISRTGEFLCDVANAAWEWGKETIQDISEGVEEFFDDASEVIDDVATAFVEGFVSIGGNFLDAIGF